MQMFDKILESVAIFIVFLMLISFRMDYQRNRMTPEKFHEMVTNKEEVNRFKEKYPCIVNNKYVYIAYLQKYYRGHEDEYHILMDSN